MMERTPLTFRLANREDDAQIRALQQRIDMPGAMSLTFTYEPDFFAAVEVEGASPRVVVGERGGAIVGMGLSAQRRLYVNGQPESVGYLGSLRADPAERNGIGLLRGYRYLRQADATVPVRFYLSTIMEDSQVARRILTSRHAGLPQYHEVGLYRTLIFPLIERRKPKADRRFRVVRGEQVGAAAIAAFLNTVGPEKQFFPVYDAEDIESSTGLLRGLRLSDFRVALAGDRIAGAMAGWDQCAFRQHRVTGYSGVLRTLRPALNLAAKCLGITLLPSPGMPARSLCAAGIAIAENDAAVFQGLLRHMLHEMHGPGRDVLMVGLAANDPLLQAAQAWRHAALSSRIYAVTWKEDNGLLPALQRRVPYLELGSL
jgi:hypothetical protein